MLPPLRDQVSHFTSFLTLATSMVLSQAFGCSDAKEPPAPSPLVSDPVFDGGAGDRVGGKVGGKHVGMKVDEIRYEATSSGLAALLEDLSKAIVASDEDETAVLLASLRLPNDEAWFETYFSEALAPLLADEYRPLREEIGSLMSILASEYNNERTEVNVEKFDQPGQPEATGYQSAALKKMTTIVPLYSARLQSVSGSKSYHLWSFVHEEGSFRFVGKLMSVIADKNRKKIGERDLNEYRLRDHETITSLKK